MFKKTPKPKNTAGKISALVTLLLGAFLFIMANAGLIALPWLAQLIGIIMLTFSIYVASAYLLRQYTFIVEPDSDAGEESEGAYDYIVYEHRSGRELKVCHVSVKSIKYVRVVTPENKKTVNAERKKMQRYTYDTTFAASRRIEIVIENGGEQASMLVIYDEEMLSALISTGITIR